MNNLHQYVVCLTHSPPEFLKWTQAVNLGHSESPLIRKGVFHKKTQTKWQTA